MVEKIYKQRVTLDFEWRECDAGGRLSVTSGDTPGILLATGALAIDSLFADLGKVIQLVLRNNHDFPPRLGIAGMEIVIDGRMPPDLMVLEKDGKVLGAVKVSSGEAQSPAATWEPEN